MITDSRKNLEAYQEFYSKLNYVIDRLMKFDYPGLGSRLFIAFSISTLNFSVYISHFSPQLTMIANVSSFSNYLFQIIVPFALILGIVRFVVFIADGVLDWSKIQIGSVKVNDKIENFILLIEIDRKMQNIFKYLITSIVFLYIYVGFFGSIKIIMIVILYHFIFFILNSKSSMRRLIFINNHSAWKALYSMFVALFRPKFYRGYIEKYVAILCLLIAFPLGTYRSYYVKDQYTYEIYHESLAEKEYTIFLTSHYGMFLFSNKDDVHFLPWDAGFVVHDQKREGPAK